MPCASRCQGWRLPRQRACLVRERARVVQVRYVMSIPPTSCFRCVIRRDFPKAGEISYLVLPFDKERHVPLEEIGVASRLKAAQLASL